MKLSPKVFFGLLAIPLTLAIIFFIFQSCCQKLSSLSITSEKNKFRVSFNIDKKDKYNFEKFLTNLDIPSEISSGASFRLDATSSAMLTFFTPIKADLNISSKEISFSGKMSHKPSNNFKVENIKVPKSTHLAIFASNVIDFLNSRYHLPEEFLKWLSKNFPTDKGQYLVMFNETDFAVLVKSDKANYDDLKNITFDKSQESADYKEETDQDVNFHLLKLGKDPSREQLTATVFNLNGYTVFSSSYKSAQKMVSVLKSEEESSTFPSVKEDQQLAFTMIYNSTTNPISQNFVKLLFSDSADLSNQNLKIINTLEKIQQASLTLKTTNFSGLIKIK